MPQRKKCILKGFGFSKDYKYQVKKEFMSCIIRDYGEKDYDAVVYIAQGLPEWFTKTGVEHMKIDFYFQKGIVAEIEGRILGFLFYFSEEGILNISWMGVAKEYQRKGIGRQMVLRFEELAKRGGVHEIRVATLGDSVEYEPYARTRAFYRALGFSDLESIMQDNPECPEKLILQKKI